MKIVVSIKTKDLKTKKYCSHTINMSLLKHKTIDTAKDRQEFIKEFLDSHFSNYTITSVKVEK